MHVDSFKGKSNTSKCYKVRNIFLSEISRNIRQEHRRALCYARCMYDEGGGQFFKLLLSVLFALGKTKQWNTVRSIPISF